MTTACTVGPDYKRPEPNLPVKYEETAQTSAPEAVPRDWWKAFANPTLDDLVEKALNSNKDVQLAVARIEEADAVLRQVGAALLPTVEVGASATRNRYTEFNGGGSQTGVKTNFTGFLSSTFELDFWGKLRRATESARAQALATRYGKDTVELTLAGLVTRNYLALRSLDDQIAVSSDTLANLLESGARIWTLGFALNLPIFDAGKRVARVDEVTAQQKQAVITYQKAIEGAFKEVRDAPVTVRRTAEGEKALEERLEATQKALKLAEARYDAGYSPYLEVLDAQRTQNDAQLVLVRNREAKLAAAVDLFKALGGGWSGQ